ncbi:hypothetical protein FHP29_02170 [Nocardioides albidus]|uniref:Acyl-CoA dehydrogenase C-terminal domain-containing protein n=1 Tax=Nocardioides albidus TaxID=1517589 RepID=A0A5C4WJ15_9ACTN|nr:hypothetical protein [Nocardioides albidus]TNM48131.1 hypothetical protein FHP29_02170 [Nocardioides albidus]
MHTHTALRDRVADLVPRIREEAARTEAERRIPTEVLAALLDAGAFALVPAAERGENGEREAEVLELVRSVAAACGSTGWVTAAGGSVPWLLDLFPPAAWERVHEQAVDPLVAFSPETAGRLTGPDDAPVLNGTWSAVTGAAHASWLLLGVRRHEVPGEPGRAGLALVPIGDCELSEPLDTVGLTASGAQDVRVRGAAVPVGSWADAEHRASELRPVGTIVAMALVGAAAGALVTHLEQSRQRLALSHGGEDVTALDLSPARIARAASLLDGAALVLREQAIGHHDPDDQPRDPFEDQLYAVDRAVETTGLVFASLRAHALDNDDPVARLWRDVRVGGYHARALISRLRAFGG